MTPLTIAVAVSVAMVLTTSAIAQSHPNIAGNYRGLMTRCLAAPQPAACRTSLTEIVRLADQVDAKRAEWSQAASGADGAQTNQLYREYSSALDRLNRSIEGFNRGMNVARSDAN